MGFSSLTNYIELKKVLFEANKLKSNLLIVSLPGLAIEYYLKKIKELEPDLSFDIYNQPNLDFKSWVMSVDDLILSAPVEKKYIFVLEDPSVLDSPAYLRSYTASHIHKVIYFPAEPDSQMPEIISDMNPTLNKKQITEIVKLSGGISSIAKYLSINYPLTSQSIDEIINNDDFRLTIQLLINNIQNSSPAHLEKLSIIKNGEFRSKIIHTFFSNLKSKFSLSINPDLTFTEKQKPSVESFTKIEAEIVNRALTNQGLITREEISDIKWGRGSYEKFSDQAINKTMQRINQKLSIYTFTSISSIGYKLS